MLVVTIDVLSTAFDRAAFTTQLTALIVEIAGIAPLNITLEMNEVNGRRSRSLVQCNDLCTSSAFPGGVQSTDPTVAALFRQYIGNGQCDDGRSGSASSICDRNTDCTDCSVYQATLCNNNCDASGRDRFGWASNGICQDGGPGSQQYGCEYGADCADCGPRDYSPPPPALSCPAAMNGIGIVVSGATKAVYSRPTGASREVLDESINGRYLQQGCDTLTGSYRYVSDNDGSVTISISGSSWLLVKDGVNMFSNTQQWPSSSPYEGTPPMTGWRRAGGIVNVPPYEPTSNPNYHLHNLLTFVAKTSHQVNAMRVTSIGSSSPPPALSPGCTCGATYPICAPDMRHLTTAGAAVGSATCIRQGLSRPYSFLEGRVVESGGSPSNACGCQRCYAEGREFVACGASWGASAPPSPSPPPPPYPPLEVTVVRVQGAGSDSVNGVYTSSPKDVCGIAPNDWVDSGQPKWIRDYFCGLYDPTGTCGRGCLPNGKPIYSIQSVNPADYSINTMNTIQMLGFYRDRDSGEQTANRWCLYSIALTGELSESNPGVTCIYEAPGPIGSDVPPFDGWTISQSTFGTTPAPSLECVSNCLGVGAASPSPPRLRVSSSITMPTQQSGTLLAEQLHTMSIEKLSEQLGVAIRSKDQITVGAQSILGSSDGSLGSWATWEYVVTIVGAAVIAVVLLLFMGLLVVRLCKKRAHISHTTQAVGVQMVTPDVSAAAMTEDLATAASMMTEQCSTGAATPMYRHVIGDIFGPVQAAIDPGQQVLATEDIVATFGPGPLGLDISQVGNVAQVASVDTDSQASKQCVTMGCTFLEVAGCPVATLDKKAVLDAIKQAERPVTIIFKASASAIERAQLRT